MATNSAANQLGLATPSATDLIRTGDNDIAQNARATVDLFRRATDTVDNLTATAHPLPHGSRPTATVMGRLPHKRVNFGVPKGEPGMGYEQGQQLVAAARDALALAQTAADDAAGAAAAAQEIPDTNVRAVFANKDSEVRAFFQTFSGAVRHASGYPSLQAACDAMPASGGVLQLEAKDYDLGSQRLVMKAGTLLKGANGALRSGATGGTATRLVYSGAEGPALTTDGSRYGIDSVSVVYTNPTFAGHVVDAGSDSTVYRAHGAFRNAWMGSLINGSEGAPAGGQYPALSCVNLHGAQNVLFDNVHLFGAQYNVSGVDYGTSTWPHSIIVGFRSCTFHRHNQWAVRNPHFSWTFDNCTFERNEAHEGRALVVEDYTGASSGVVPVGVHLNNCWFGDNTEPGDWIEWRGNGLVLTGGRAVNIGSMVKMMSEGSTATLVGVSATAASAGQGYGMVDVTAAPGASVTMINCVPGGNGQLWRNGVPSTHRGSLTTGSAGTGTNVGRLVAGGGSIGAPGLSIGDAASTNGFTHSASNSRLSIIEGGQEAIRVTGSQTQLLGTTRHFGSALGFYGASPIARPTLTPDATPAQIRAALINLGLVAPA